MKFAVFLYHPEPAEGFDINFYRIKPESGTVGKPTPHMYTNIACFGDNQKASEHPEWIAVSKDGPATRLNKKYNFRWDILCMTNPELVEETLNFIEENARVSPGISLSSMHFADHGFCICPRCMDLWRKSGLSWTEWRAQVVTDFVKKARDRVGSKPLFINILPDPVLGKERFGYNYDEIANYADAFVVPMFSRSYITSWYFETLARAFKRILKKPVFVNLYVYGPGENPQTVPTVEQILTVSCRIARTGVDGIIYLAENAWRIRDFQRAAVQNKKLLEELEGSGGEEVVERVRVWESLF
ncbi:MAG: hypothetical protein RMK50_06650 [Nitrososphaerota archaeon]|nr:hypothetical protein [Candidatus Bathyarchaeota archaeon]MDW8194481.1 hypothetical protein [Nitrososphaerota archaeon]